LHGPQHRLKSRLRLRFRDITVRRFSVRVALRDLQRMSNTLAKRLMEATSADAFLRTRPSGLDWGAFASLKLEVDRLVNIDLNVAARLVDRIERVAILSADPLPQAFARASRARLLHLRGEHREANLLYDAAAKTLREHKLLMEAAVIRRQQIDALTQLGRYDDALAVGHEARRVLGRAGPVELAKLETNIGNTYYRLDRYKQALNRYERAGDLLASAGDADLRAHVDLSRSNILSEMDRPYEALQLLKGAAAIWTRRKQWLMASQALSKIAYLDFLRGSYSAALAGYYDAREQLEELGSPRLVAWCNLEIAEVLLALNAFTDASEAAAIAGRSFTELEMPYESAQSSMVAGLASMGLAQFDVALSELTRARAVYESRENQTFTAIIDSYLSELAIRRGDPEEASRRAGLASKTFTRQKLVTRIAYSRLLAARAAYQAGERRKAKRLASSALRSIEGRFAPSITYLCHNLIGKIARDQGRASAALESFRRAVEIVEEMRGGIAADEFKATFLADKVEVYEDAIRACLDAGSDAAIQEAFRLVEAAKSRGLADLLARYLREAGSPRRSKPGPKDDTREELAKLIEELNWYSSHATLEDERGGQRRAQVADRYSRESARCERQIAHLFRRFEDQGATPDGAERLRAATVRELQDTLEPDETAIEYFTTEDQVSAFVVSRDGIEIVRALASKRAVETTLAALRFQIEKFNYGPGYADEYFEQLNQATNQYLGILSRDLVAGLESMVKHQRLIVIPHGALHYVPFHALLNRRGYLLDQFEISYSPSATVLKLCRQMAKQTKGSKLQTPRAADRLKLVALGLGGHDTPAVAGEINALASLFPNTVKLTGAKATRENLLRAAPNATYLHLASHGYFRRDNPMFSFLKLADSNLNFYSLLDLKLSADLVTLSACHTGVNKVFPGDELHGLMRGFLHAGAPSLVASLWATSDSSTAVLMREMYSRISEGASKSAALRSAQLAVKDEYGHPYYWAPFILMGNPN
jgi:CHAT domain-containing protein